MTALVDLNKPVYRLGIAEIKVGWEPHRLEVEVSPERAEYWVRETARVRLQVRRADGAALPTGAEVAIAAVDEALLKLAPNLSWELLAAMMGRRGLEVSTATAQMQVVGKRHYGRKALRDEAAWRYWMRRLPAYMDRQGLLKYFPAETLPGEDVLTAYVLALAHEAGWEIPAAERQRLLQALVGFAEGHIVRGSALPTADLTVRKLAAIEALARHGAARPHLIDSFAVEPALWPTSAVIDWLNILRRMPQLPRAGEQAATAEAVLRTRLNFQGTTLGFSTEGTDALWWLMVSGDSNAVRMLLAVLDRPGWREDLPRLVRGALGRQQRGHWSTTVANAWGVVAMEKFSAAFEATPVTGTTAIRYGTHIRSVKWPQAASASSATLTPTPTSAALSSSTSTQTSPSPTAPPPLSATISRSSSRWAPRR